MLGMEATVKKKTEGIKETKMEFSWGPLELDYGYASLHYTILSTFKCV